MTVAMNYTEHFISVFFRFHKDNTATEQFLIVVNEGGKQRQFHSRSLVHSGKLDPYVLLRHRISAIIPSCGFAINLLQPPPIFCVRDVLNRIVIEWSQDAAANGVFQRESHQNGA